MPTPRFCPVLSGTWACVLLLRVHLTLGRGVSVKLQFERFYGKKKSHPGGGILEDPVNIAFKSVGAQSSLKGEGGAETWSKGGLLEAGGRRAELALGPHGELCKDSIGLCPSAPAAVARGP